MKLSLSLKIFFVLSSKSDMYCTLMTHLNLVAKFSLKIFDLYLDFIKHAVEKVESHFQVVENILKSFPVIE